MFSKKSFKLFYYSHMQLVFMAMVLTGTISAVIYGEITWQVILLVGLSTYMTYSLDNLIDWNRDKHRYTKMTGLIHTYHKFTYGLIPGAAIGIILLVVQSSNELRIGLLLLGAAAAMSTTRFSNYRENSSGEHQKLLGFFLNRLFISLVWTTVCVFLAVWYVDLPIIPRTWHTFVYMFVLILSYSVIWKLEKSPYPLQKEVFSSPIPAALALLSVVPFTLVIYDIMIGIAPLQNLVNLAPPVANLVGMLKISQNPFNLQKKISLWTLILLLLCSISMGFHLIFAG
jgi:hypothetical protein